ncbi:hypothetical protein BGZ75_007830 [Mortierella antarctica]|nr:hypothetical protein BGZ75_007830 [Mortierella antarctica]
MSTPPKPNEDDNEQLFIGEPMQDCLQPAGGNRKTRRKMQKKAKTHHYGPMMASNASVSEEGAPMDMADGHISAQSPSSSSISSSSLLLSERFSDVASSEHNTPKPSPAVLHSPIHGNAKDDPFSVTARSGKEVWIWPQDLPASSCEMVLRWIYLGAVPSTPLQDFNAMYALLCRLSNRVLLQAYVTAQRRAIETHPSPLDLLAAADYNVGPAKVLLRPVLVATIKKKWASISTGTALASMFTGPDPSGVLVSVIQTLPAPQC